MKKLSKVLVLVLSAIMVLAMSASVFAANSDITPDPAVDTNTGSIVISNANKGQTYTAYRIFEAIVNAEDTSKVSYRMLSGKTMPDNDYFKVDSVGNVTITDAGKDSTDDTKLSVEAVEWLTANYGTIGEQVASGTATEDGEQKITKLPFGYYYITTTTGTVVSVDTTNISATVTDKNDETEVDKEITGVADGSVAADKEAALAQIGTVVSYESRIPIKVGAYNYKFTDTMSSGLTLNAESVKVYIVDSEDAAVAEDAEDVNAACGNVVAANQEADNAADITITFGADWLKTNEGKTIVIQYSATVNENAVVAGEGNPNTAKIEYGNTDTPITNENEVKVYTAKITVTKNDGNNTEETSDDTPLAGAGFVLMKGNQYYHYENGVVSWTDSYTENDIHTSDDEGAVPAFVGLADGTYTLVEVVTPEGYNTAADTEVVVNAATTAGFEQNLAITSTILNNAGSVLPSTGGIGTTIFYILGSALVIGCGIVLISRKRMQNK